MNSLSLASRGLVHHWRSHVGVLIGATVATAILVGALAVGDSVRYSLREMALARLGSVNLALNAQAQFFRVELADGLAAELKSPTAPVVNLRGTAASGSGDARVGGIQVLGVDDRFWSLAPTAGRPIPQTPPQGAAPDPSNSAFISENLAHALRVKAGDDVVLRVDKPSLLSRDAPLSTIEDSSVQIRLPVAGVLSDSKFGRFSLAANQVAPSNVYLPIGFLQNKLGVEGRANLLLVGAAAGKSITPSDATQALWKHWKLDDSGLAVKPVPNKPEVELRTERVFLDPPVGDAASKAVPGATGVLTYFVNELKAGEKSTPYSAVAAMDSSPVPPGMSDDEIVINQWLADDLSAKPGDSIQLSYWTVGAMRKLIAKTSNFRIKSIVPLSGVALDPALMPNIPGLADKKDCRDWEPGVPIDLKKIRDKDQAYWSAYRGTPKAFITLRAGQRIWDNRFGNLTAVRYETGGDAAQAQSKVETCLRQALSPASLGLFFMPVREQALNASGQSMDFGTLFIGFSFFLIVAALILTALLFAFAVEQRSEEIGTLLALGWTPGKVRRLLLTEGAFVSIIASSLGSVLAVLYTKALVSGLTTVWKGAVGSTALKYHAEPSTLLIGAVASFFVAMFSVYLIARKQAKSPARVLLSGGSEQPVSKGRRRAGNGLPTAICALGGGFVFTLAALKADRESAVEYFFGGGALLLIGGVALCLYIISLIERRIGNQSLSLTSLGVRNAVRRRGRSLSAVGLLACGSFLVIAIGANRQDPSAGAEKRSSGTGGFALFAQSSLPVYQDLNSTEGLDAYGLKTQDLRGAKVVPLRLKEGDDASCLNLNRAQNPQILGVNPGEFAGRKAFTFAQLRAGVSDSTPDQSSWRLLQTDLKGDEIPVIGDTNTITWSLGKSLGDTLDYTDDRGRTRKLKIVGVLANSILQGSLVMSEDNFIKVFPGSSGYRAFLLDASASQSLEVSKTLSKSLEDVGLSVTPAAERLASFNAVEETYLSIFAILGGFGLLLGSFGLGVIVLRNVLERRSELALLRAVGFRMPKLQWMIFSEHVLLLAMGLLVGVISALVAVLPALRTPGVDTPYVSLSLTLIAVLLSGLVWIWGAASAAIRGPLLNALRNE